MFKYDTFTNNPFFRHTFKVDPIISGFYHSLSKCFAHLLTNFNFPEVFRKANFICDTIKIFSSPL